MRIQEADAQIQNNILGHLTKYAFPVYCATGVEEFDYYFIGCGFFVKWDDRCFFVMTEHQYNKALVGNIFVLYGDETKGISVRSGKGVVFHSSDLVIFELPDPSDLIVSDRFLLVPKEMLLPPKSYDGCQVVCSGYPTKRSAVDYPSKTIAPKIFGFISDEFSIIPGRKPIQVCLDEVEFTGTSDIADLDDATQGLSGSPVIVHKLEEDGRMGEFALLGVATHTTTVPKALYATQTLELVDCLQRGFGLFEEQKAHDE